MTTLRQSAGRLLVGMISLGAVLFAGASLTERRVQAASYAQCPCCIVGTQEEQDADCKSKWPTAVCHHGPSCDGRGCCDVVVSN